MSSCDLYSVSDQHILLPYNFCFLFVYYFQFLLCILYTLCINRVKCDNYNNFTSFSCQTRLNLYTCLLLTSMHATWHLHLFRERHAEPFYPEISGIITTTKFPLNCVRCARKRRPVVTPHWVGSPEQAAI